MRVRTILVYAAVFLCGALTMYIFLWWQVFNHLDVVSCQVFHGQASVELADHCKKVLEKHQ